MDKIITEYYTIKMMLLNILVKFNDSEHVHMVRLQAYIHTERECLRLNRDYLLPLSKFKTVLKSELNDTAIACDWKISMHAIHFKAINPLFQNISLQNQK